MGLRRPRVRGACIAVAVVLAAPAVPAAASVAGQAPAPPWLQHPGTARTPHSQMVNGLPAWRVDVRLLPDQSTAGTEVPRGVAFSDVEAAGPHDAWAVGTSGRFLGPWSRPVAWHWHDGRWHAAATPRWLDGSRVGGWVNQLEAVGGSSPSDIWALGPYFLLTESIVRAVHWDGHRWARFAVPSVGSSAPLVNSVVSFGKRGAWAFGCYCDLRFQPSIAAPYIASFYRGSWHEVTPRGRPLDSIWTASANSPSDIWAVMTEPNTGISAVLHWNGRKWRVLTVPLFGKANNPVQFFASGGIAVTKNDAVWLSGSASGGSAAVAYEAGGRWTLTTVAGQGQFAALIPDGKGGLWTSMRTFTNTSDEIWHFSGGHWSRAADAAGVSGLYFITWMAHVPGGTTSLAIGDD